MFIKLLLHMKSQMIVKFELHNSREHYSYKLFV